MQVADPPEAWARAGFTVGDDGTCLVGEIGHRLLGRARGTGIVGWSLGGLPIGCTEVDGIPTYAPTASGTTEVPQHPNGVVGVDHVVLLSPSLARTVAALGDLDVRPRRERDGSLGGAPMRQVFFRLGSTILEVVGSPDAVSDEPSSLWGLTYAVADIDATAVRLGEAVGRVKDAVQPGRRITTLRHRDLGMSVRTAFISPHVSRGAEGVPGQIVD